MDVSEELIDPTFKGPIECPNMKVTSVHFYISILEDVTTTMPANLGTDHPVTRPLISQTN